MDLLGRFASYRSLAYTNRFARTRVGIAHGAGILVTPWLVDEVDAGVTVEPSFESTGSFPNTDQRRPAKAFDEC